MIIFAPVYNGQPPPIWYNHKYILIGDAAHPYGPGGQGISMALKDAKAVSNIIIQDFHNETLKQEYHNVRGKESRTWGESAEKRNQQVTNQTDFQLTIQGYKMKLLKCFLCGKVNM